MLFIIAGIVAGVLILNYPEMLIYLAIGCGSAIVVGIVFVCLSACVCSKPRQSKGHIKTFATQPMNGKSARGGSAIDLKEMSASSPAGLNGITPVSRPSDAFLNSAVEKGEFFHNSSVDVPSAKRHQKPVTSSPRTTKARMAEFQESPKIPEIPKTPRGEDSFRKAKPKNLKKFPNAPSSVGDFTSLGLQQDDTVFDGMGDIKGAAKPSVKGRGQMPLTAFKQTSKSVSDLDDDTSFESGPKPQPQQQQRSVAKPRTPQLDHRLAVSCHNILSEEPVRVGIAHLRQREAAARKPPIPRKVTGVALPGMAHGAAMSQDDLSRVRRKAFEPSTRPTDPCREQQEDDPKKQLQHKSVPDFFPKDDQPKLNILNDTSSFSKPARSTTPLSQLNTSTSSYAEPPRPEDLDRYNTVGLPTPPPSLQPKPFRSTDAQPFRMYAPKPPKSGLDKQPLMSEWTVSVSSKSDTFSSDDADCPRQLSSSQELLMGSSKCLETEI